ncbi:hypothetical protein M422DRAFT_251125, partial [Sphaerobolus stellatus SS14]
MTPCRKLSASEQDFVFREEDLVDPDNPMDDGLLQNDADAQDVDAQDDDDAVMEDAAALSDKDAVMKDCDEDVLNNDDNQAALSEDDAAQKDLSGSSETEEAAELRVREEKLMAEAALLNLFHFVNAPAAALFCNNTKDWIQERLPKQIEFDFSVEVNSWLKTYVNYLNHYRHISVAPDLPGWVNGGPGPDWQNQDQESLGVFERFCKWLSIVQVVYHKKGVTPLPSICNEVQVMIEQMSQTFQVDSNFYESYGYQKILKLNLLEDQTWSMLRIAQCRYNIMHTTSSEETIQLGNNICFLLKRLLYDELSISNIIGFMLYGPAIPWERKVFTSDTEIKQLASLVKEWFWMFTTLEAEVPKVTIPVSLSQLKNRINCWQIGFKKILNTVEAADKRQEKRKVTDAVEKEKSQKKSKPDDHSKSSIISTISNPNTASALPPVPNLKDLAEMGRGVITPDVTP